MTKQLDTMGPAFEKRMTEAYQNQAFDAVKAEHPQYFDALEKHPRLLVGMTVPAVGKEGTETLRDANDAREWQEAVKSVLVAEINSRATDSMQQSQQMMETVHNSIQLFRTNPDLIPGTPNFDRGLADALAAMIKPYEIRAEGNKLIGYSIPVQPLLDQLREQRKTAAAVAPAAPAAPPAGVVTPAPAASTPAAPAEPPQAGVTSKAGATSEKEDFSTLFGTIGLPNIQI